MLFKLRWQIQGMFIDSSRFIMKSHNLLLFSFFNSEDNPSETPEFRHVVTDITTQALREVSFFFSLNKLNFL